MACYHELCIFKIFESVILVISQYASHPVILRGAEGEVAESLIQKNPRPSGEGGLRRRWVRVRQEHLTNTLFLL